MKLVSKDENMTGDTKNREQYIARVKLARENSGLKHREVADLIGCSREAYTNYESRRPMPQKYLAKFCEATKARSEWLLTGKGAMTNDQMDTLFEEIEEMWSSFSEDYQREINDYVKDLKRVQDRKDRIKDLES
tara:strand:- start:269 stop:670 length:402 start_codon:yes stop_codon:yes gene_type:complete